MMAEFRSDRHATGRRAVMPDSANYEPPAVAIDLESRIAEAWSPAAWQDVPVVVAVSGGADSVALVRILERLRPPSARLWVAHFNHRWRGAAAEADERFVAELAASLKLGYRAGRASDEDLATTGEGREGAARQARYSFLTRTAEELGARYVAVAHTADDQAETILQRVLRGTGPAGLAGMPRVRRLSDAVSLVRPLLSIRRQELRTYLAAIQQVWREDATNAQTDATRNWIRHELLPAAAERVNPSVVDAVVRLGALAGEMQQVVAAAAKRIVERSIESTTGGTLVCRCDALAGEPRYLVREALKLAWRRAGWPEQAMGFAEWEALAEMACDCSPAGRQRDLPGGVRAQRDGTRLLLRAAARS